MPIRFINGQFISVPAERLSDGIPSTESPTQHESRSDDILDVLARVQRDLNAAQADKRKALASANEYRLMTFPEIPSESRQKVQFIIVDELKKDGGLERVQRFLNYHREITSMLSNMIEDFRSKASIKIKVDRSSEDGLKVAEASRNAPRAKKGPLRFTQEEKVIANFWKQAKKNSSYGKLGVTQLVKVVQALNPSITEDSIRKFVEKMNARDMSKTPTTSV